MQEQEETAKGKTPVMPVVNRNRCEGKSECVAVCPENIFVVRVMDDADFARLSILGKLKSVAHGKKTAYTPNAEACMSCGLCVPACPEDAIRLIPQPRK